MANFKLLMKFFCKKEKKIKKNKKKSKKVVDVFPKNAIMIPVERMSLTTIKKLKS